MQYEQPLLTIDLVVFAFHQEELSVLVVKRDACPFEHHWALPQGEINPTIDVSLEAAAKRHLKQLTGYEALYLEQVQTLGNQQRDPRGWSVAIVYYCLAASSQVLSGKSLQWIKINDIVGMKLAFDNHQVIDSCLQRFQNKSLYTSLPLFLLPEEFSLTELQKAYESILGFKMEKKSFRRRLLEAGFLEKTGNIRRAKHRPAQLYRLTSLQPYFFPRIIEGVRDSKNVE
ncbi:MAG: hypothetical protein BGO43_10150 [Gammaproteobacteria bacterium 39-13]|nr:NUDIX hydrolase [Gammaproteobacteria bacterium]OJV90288.1 MAG: hypothetical protein BGO43_10150 [Gammaproteobacteria bacterium 39-13]